MLLSGYAGVLRPYVPSSRGSPNPGSPAGNANRDLCFSHRTSRIASGTLVFLREVGIDAVGVECLRICPFNLRSSGSLQRSFLADLEPLFDNPFLNLLDERIEFFQR